MYSIGGTVGGQLHGKQIKTLYRKTYMYVNAYPLNG